MSTGDINNSAGDELPECLQKDRFGDKMIEMIRDLYQFLDIEIQAGIYDLAGMASVLFVLLAGLWIFLHDREGARPSKKISSLPTSEDAPKKIKRSWKTRLHQGMNKSRGQFWHPLADLFRQGGLSPEVLDEVEEVLYGADLGPTTTQLVLDELVKQVGNKNYELEDLKQFIKNILQTKMGAVQNQLQRNFLQFDPNRPHTLQVVMVVGVNGAGKTTTIGKLASQLQQQGAKVVVGACDTFRVAAVDQLQVWCERARCEIVRAKDGADPSGVAYGALQQALSSKADYCLLDTAGRLHTKANLMEELKKSKRVLGKLDESAPHEVLLVLDAITGQNALRQAEEFNRALKLTGLILTKCDGSAKAGSAVAIVERLQVPITHIGVGEGVEDLNRFDMDEYTDAMLP